MLEGWRQAHEYGGHLPACMVMSCLSNRVRLGWGTWLEVLNRIPAFSAVKEQPNREIFPSVWEPSFVRLLHEVEAIYDGSQDYSKGAVYWCDLRYVETPFFKEKILGGLGEHARVCDMNTLVCFR